jgi:excisionase family DNA binding protein
MNDDILTIPEVAELLRIAEKTVYALAQRGEIPGFKVGGQWRFSRAAIDSWIEARSRAPQHPPSAIEQSRAVEAPSGYGSKARKRRR